MGFQLAPKSATLNDLEQPNCRHIALFHTKRQLSCQSQLRQSH